MKRSLIMFHIHTAWGWVNALFTQLKVCCGRVCACSYQLPNAYTYAKGKIFQFAWMGCPWRGGGGYAGSPSDPGGAAAGSGRGLRTVWRSCEWTLSRAYITSILHSSLQQSIVSSIGLRLQPAVVHLPHPCIGHRRPHLGLATPHRIWTLENSPTPLPHRRHSNGWVPDFGVAGEGASFDIRLVHPSVDAITILVHALPRLQGNLNTSRQFGVLAPA